MKSSVCIWIIRLNAKLACHRSVERLIPEANLQRISIAISHTSFKCPLLFQLHQSKLEFDFLSFALQSTSISISNSSSTRGKHAEVCWKRFVLQVFSESHKMGNGILRKMPPPSITTISKALTLQRYTVQGLHRPYTVYRLGDIVESTSIDNAVSQEEALVFTRSWLEITVRHAWDSDMNCISGAALFSAAFFRHLENVDIGGCCNLMKCPHFSKNGPNNEREVVEIVKERLLMKMVGYVVDLIAPIAQSEALNAKPVVRQLGRRHAMKKIVHEQLEVFCDVLLLAVVEMLMLGTSSNIDRVISSWVKVMSHMVHEMGHDKLMFYPDLHRQRIHSSQDGMSSQKMSTSMSLSLSVLGQRPVHATWDGACEELVSEGVM